MRLIYLWCLLIGNIFCEFGIKRNKARQYPPVILSPLPSADDIPTVWDWRNVSGVNYLTANVNQHIPRYCGSCWLHAGIAVLNDRLKIARRAKWPEINLARQVVLNCGAKVAGSCEGGSDYGVFVFAWKYGIPDDTCQPYDAQEHFCTPFRNCMNCDPEISAVSDLHQKQPRCYPVQRYGRYFVREFGRLKHPHVREMQAEITKRGPISCSVDAKALEYGRYKQDAVIAVTLDDKRKMNNETSELVIFWEPDHNVEIVGWGQDEAGLHWIVRNSWGGYWGDHGIFKVRLGINSIGIEDLCHWAVIDPEPVIDDWGPDDSSRIFASTDQQPEDLELWKDVVPRIYRKRARLDPEELDLHPLS
jgi:cathepsin X